MGKLIDSDVLKEYIKNCEFCKECKEPAKWCYWCQMPDGLTKQWEMALDEQPEAVVRCKDCKYCKLYDLYDDIPWCERLTGTFRVEKKSFCSFGKRRTE